MALIGHQTAGYGCNKEYMVGTVLEIRPEVKDKIETIDEYWFNTDCGAFQTIFDEIVKYGNQLNDLLDVDCNESYRSLKEGIYLIDCSSEVIRKLSTDEFPDDLDDLIK